MATELKRLPVIDCENGYGRLAAEKCIRWWQDSNGEGESTWYKHSLCVSCTFGQARAQAVARAAATAPKPVARLPKPKPQPATRTSSSVGSGNAKVDKPCVHCRELMLQVHPARQHHADCKPTSEMRTAQLADVQRILKTVGLRKTTLAAMCGLSKTTVCRVLSGQRGMPLALAFAIEGLHEDAPRAQSWVGL